MELLMHYWKRVLHSLRSCCGPREVFFLGLKGHIPELQSDGFLWIFFFLLLDFREIVITKDMKEIGKVWHWISVLDAQNRPSACTSPHIGIATYPKYFNLHANEQQGFGILWPRTWIKLGIILQQRAMRNFDVTYNVQLIFISLTTEGSWIYFSQMQVINI